MNGEDLAKYLYEAGQLKRVKRSGWWMAGIDDPESVAEHSYRAAIIGFVLAKLEGVDPYKVATMCVFHDLHEARTNDPHRVAGRYLKWEGMEEHVTSEQAQRLPADIAEIVVGMMHAFENETTPEARLAHDADLLECVFQAREYQAQGHKDVEDWIKNCKAGLQSESAKRIAEACLVVEPSAWWRGLKIKKSRVVVNHEPVVVDGMAGK